MADLTPGPNGQYLLRQAGRPDVQVRHNPHWRSRPDADMRALAPFLSDIDRHIDTACAALVAEFAPIWREAWRLPEEPELTDDAFGARLRLVTVGYPDAQYGAPCVNLGFDDDGLFRGHALFATLWLKDGTVRKTELFG